MGGDVGNGFNGNFLILAPGIGGAGEAGSERSEGPEPKAKPRKARPPRLRRGRPESDKEHCLFLVDCRK